jgi:hypothetical protein
MRRAILASALLVGCAPKLSSVEDEPISAAWLEHFDLSSIAVLGGVADGDAFLGYTTLDGTTRSLPVHLGGPIVGVVMDMTVDPEWGPSIPLDLSEAEVDPVMLSDALGTYKGAAASFAMGIGVSTRELRNRHGIGLQDDHLAFGVGIMGGFSWVRIREGGSEQGEEDWITGLSDDTNAPPDDSGGDDSGGTDDTAIADDSGASDDSGTADDSATSADDSGGSDDSGASDDSGGAGQTPPPRRSKKDGCGGGDDSGGGSDGSSDDSSGDGGCCCGAANSAVIVGAWLLLGGRRLRRRV